MTAPTSETTASETPVTPTVARPPRKALNPILKFALELGPLVVFFIVMGAAGIGGAFAAGEPEGPASRNPGPVTQPAGPKGTKDSSAKPKKKKAI